MRRPDIVLLVWKEVMNMAERPIFAEIWAARRSLIFIGIVDCKFNSKFLEN